MNPLKKEFIDLAEAGKSIPPGLAAQIAEFLKREQGGAPRKTDRDSLIRAAAAFLQSDGRSRRKHKADQARRLASAAFNGPQDERSIQRICNSKPCTLLLSVETEGGPLELFLADGIDGVLHLEPSTTDSAGSTTFKCTFPAGMWRVSIDTPLDPE